MNSFEELENDCNVLEDEIRTLVEDLEYYRNQVHSISQQLPHLINRYKNIQRKKTQHLRRMRVEEQNKFREKEPVLEIGTLSGESVRLPVSEIEGMTYSQLDDKVKDKFAKEYGHELGDSYMVHSGQKIGTENKNDLIELKILADLKKNVNTKMHIIGKVNKEES